MFAVVAMGYGSCGKIHGFRFLRGEDIVGGTEDGGHFAASVPFYFSKQTPHRRMRFPSSGTRRLLQATREAAEGVPR